YFFEPRSRGGPSSFPTTAAPFSGLLLRTPFTGFFAERLGPPLTAGFQAPIISPSPVYGASRVWLEPLHPPTSIPMSKNYYAEINLHFPCNSKRSMPVLAVVMEKLAYQFIVQ